jgi:peptidoglycan/LPS O-acetylase OafA/YrhL
MDKLNNNNLNRFIELDALRGIAAIGVLISHYTWAYYYHFNILSSNMVFLPYGEWGVQMFFIISGYVIFMTLEKVRSVKEFSIARITRLYPTYWASILLTLTFLHFFPVPTLGNYSLSLILINFTMLQSFMRTGHVDQVYWSLCVEIAFYGIMGCLFFFKKLKHIEIISVLWLLLSLIIFLPDFPLKKYIVVILILKNAPLFITGIMFYKIRTRVASIWNHLIILISLIVYSLIFYSDRILENMDYIPLSLIIIVFATFYLLVYRKVDFLKSPVFLFLGSISYPLYLLHNVIGYSIIYRVRMFTDNHFISFLIPTAISILLAYLVSIYVEKPSMHILKTKLFQLFNVKRQSNNLDIIIPNLGIEENLSPSIEKT